MLIPNLKFLALPLIALAVIAALPASGTGKSQVETRTVVVPAKPAAGCDQTLQLSRCEVAMQLSTTLVR